MASPVAKRILDITVSGVAIIVLSPFFLLIALIIVLSSPGGAFFVQGRLGLNGSVFSMIKFRTMIKNAEKTGTGLYSFDDDPRITRVGRWLRLTSLDELPQLFNVLRGDMSIVGPRPPVTYELGDFSTFTGALLRRFELKPGITGLAQVSGRNDLEWDSKIIFDNEYIDKYRRLGISYDLYLIARTALIVLSMGSVVEKRNDESL